MTARETFAAAFRRLVDRPRARFVLVVLAAALAIAATRGVFAIGALSRGPVEGDEIQVTLSSLDRFLGVPPVTLAWPATVQQMLFLPVVGLDYLCRSGAAPGTEGFVRYLCQAYRVPWRSIWYMRLIVIAISSLGLATLSVRVGEKLGSRLAGLSCAALLTTQPFLWRQCCLATGDGPSIGFLAAALGTLLADLERRTTLATAGVLIGLALASKVTTLLALPIVVALIWHYAPRPWRALGYVLAFAAVGGILGCPYLFTDPLRLAKSVVGNLFRPGEPVGMATAVQLLAEPVLRWPLLLLVAAASLIAVVGRSWTMLAGLLACLGAAVLSTTGAGIVYPRYYTSIALIAVLFTVLVSWETGASLAWRFGPRPPLRAIPAMLLAALLVFQTYLGLKELKGSPNPYSLAADDLGSLPPGTRAIVPLESLHWMVEHASSASLERMAATCEHGAIGGRSLDGFVASRYADLDGIVPILANALNEDEQAFAARVRAAAGVEDRTGIDLRVFARPCDAERLSLLTREEAVRQWRSGQVDAVVLDRPLGDEIAARRYAKGSRVVLWRYDRGAASASP